MSDVVFFISLIGCFILGTVFGINVTHNNIEKRAITENFAVYNSTTGKFQWLDKDVKFVIVGENNEIY